MNFDNSKQNKNIMAVLKVMTPFLKNKKILTLILRRISRFGCT
jgi:hypothetical protein